MVANAQGEDVLEPEQDILINPKNFVLQPNAQQVIRVGFSRPLSKEEMAQEKTWRIVFKEIACGGRRRLAIFIYDFCSFICG